jgi:transposase InsO family protein
VRTSPYYPRSNGKLERYHRTIKADALRVEAPSSLEEAQRGVAELVTHYHTVRLHSAIGFVTPHDKGLVASARSGASATTPASDAPVSSDRPRPEPPRRIAQKDAKRRPG